MVVYIGQTSDSRFVQDIEAFGWGRIWSTARAQRCQPDEPTAIDNGAYSAWRSGRPWDGGKFLARLERIQADELVPDWVVIPDAVGEAVASVKRSWKWVGRLPDGWPRYFAVQDGVRIEAVEAFVPHVDGIFLGGLPEFQHRTAGGWVRFAHERGLKAHWGGLGKAWELRAAIQHGFDSVDGSQMLWSREKWSGWKRLWKAETSQARLL